VWFLGDLYLSKEFRDAPLFSLFWLRSKMLALPISSSKIEILLPLWSISVADG
jgi:hypothetical protein